MKILIFILLSFYFEILHIESQSLDITKSKTRLPVLEKEKSYPTKNINIKSEVSYIPLETKKEILLDNDSKIEFISNKLILITNKRKGDVFFFNKMGKIISHFNQKGRIGYNRLTFLAYDEKMKEVYILDHSTKKTFVYDENGTLKRSFNFPPDSNIAEIYNFDDTSLLAYHEHLYGTNTQKKPYMFLSKKDGSIISKLNITINKPNPESLVYEKEGQMKGYTILHFCPNNCKFGNDFMIANNSSDTVYILKQDKSLYPLFVQYPSVFSEHPTSVSVGYLKDQYIYLCVSSYDLKQFKEFNDKNKKWQPSYKYFLFDNKNGQFYLDDKKGAIGVYKIDIPKNENANLLDAYYLIEALKKGRLKGELKNIATKLKVEDNPIVEHIYYN